MAKQSKGYRIPIYRCRLVKSGSQRHPVERVDCASHCAEVLQALTKDSPCERFFVVYLDGSNGLLGVEQVAQGGLHGAAITPREVLRGALIANASAIVVGHNHPSGDPTPSAEDVEMTRVLKVACEAVGLVLLDHVVVTARGGWESLLDSGALARP